MSDFEYEFQMAGMNARLNPTVETVFLMASEGNQFISSRFVKEIGRLGGEIASSVSPRVAARLRTPLRQNRHDFVGFGFRSLIQCPVGHPPVDRPGPPPYVPRPRRTKGPAR